MADQVKLLRRVYWVTVAASCSAHVYQAKRIADQRIQSELLQEKMDYYRNLSKLQNNFIREKQLSASFAMYQIRRF